MTFYSQMQDTATRLLTDYGATLNFQRVTPGGYNPATGSTTSPTTENFNGIGVEVEYKQIEIDGERILQGDKKLIMNAMATAPKIDDVVTVGGIDYRIMAVMPKNPAGTVITYELQVRI